jgi:DNA-binding MurR/RpiR family transcriptional regulator
MILEEIYKLSRESGTVNGDISLVIIDELLKKGSFNLTVTELSQRTGCSQPSASRYAKKVGSNYYKKMVKMINEEAPDYFSRNSLNKEKETIRLAKEELKTTLSQSLEYLSDAEIYKIASLILKAKKINVVAMGGNLSVKQEIEYKLSQIGKSPLLAVD